MTEPRDPIETWLGADVELLPPAPGSFERIHHRARRRRAARAVTAACGAAVVIVAAVVLPQVAGNLLPGHGGPNKASGQTTTSAPSHRPKHRSASPGPHGSAISQG